MITYKLTWGYKGFGYRTKNFRNCQRAIEYALELVYVNLDIEYYRISASLGGVIINELNWNKLDGQTLTIENEEKPYEIY